MKIIPVIHIENIDQVHLNINTCLSCDVRDVFLISHKSGKKGYFDLREAYDFVKEFYPIVNVGINILQYSIIKSVVHLNDHFPNLKYFWADNPRIGEMDSKSRPYSKTISDFIKATCSPDLMYFGGVAFKYQPKNLDLKFECESATTIMDVITTSGDATGSAPDTSKIIQIKQYIGTKPLAIASGLDFENVKEFKKYADYGLVASSITDENELIIEEKLKQIIENSK